MIAVLFVRPDGLFKRGGAYASDEARSPFGQSLSRSARCHCFSSSNYIVGIGVSALIFTVAAAALNLVYGFTGLLSFASSPSGASVATPRR